MQYARPEYPKRYWSVYIFGHDVSVDGWRAGAKRCEGLWPIHDPGDSAIASSAEVGVFFSEEIGEVSYRHRINQLTCNGL